MKFLSKNVNRQLPPFKFVFYSDEIIVSIISNVIANATTCEVIHISFLVGDKMEIRCTIDERRSIKYQLSEPNQV